MKDKKEAKEAEKKGARASAHASVRKGPYRRRVRAGAGSDTGAAASASSTRASWSQRVTLTAAWAAWRKSVFQRDGYRCILCPRTPAAALAFRVLDRHLEPHHIIRKIDRPDLMYDVDNGVTLCNSCHAMVTGAEAVHAPRFHNYISRLRAREAEMYTVTGLSEIAGG